MERKIKNENANLKNYEFRCGGHTLKQFLVCSMHLRFIINVGSLLLLLLSIVNLVVGWFI